MIQRTTALRRLTLADESCAFPFAPGRAFSCRAGDTLCVPLEKGIICANARTFVEDRFSAQEWSDLVKRMDPEDAATLHGLVATAWYDVGLVMRLFRRMIADLGDGDDAFLESFARFQAERDLTVTYRLFFRLANPAFVLEKAMSYWSRFHDSGQWIIERRSPTSANGTLLDFDVADALFCRHLGAYIKRMFELVGANDTRVEHVRCRARGDGKCEFAVSWR